MRVCLECLNPTSSHGKQCSRYVPDPMEGRCPVCRNRYEDGHVSGCNSSHAYVTAEVGGE